jgi:hypothetical protein
MQNSPASDLKNAVGLTIEYDTGLSLAAAALTSSASSSSFAFWNSSSGFCTQIAERSTKCFAPAALAASRTALVAR